MVGGVDRAARRRRFWGKAFTTASYSMRLIAIIEPWRAAGIISYLFQAGTPVLPET